MQKEALVHNASNGVTWRMVCYEVPYLKGTDLAPFPLAFYAAGMAFSFLFELQRHAAVRGVPLRTVTLCQENYYTMRGSAIRGDTTGGAEPSEHEVQVETPADAESVTELVRLAESTSPAQSYMRDVLLNSFSLTLNGQPVAPTEVRPSPLAPPPDPEPYFDAATPLERAAGGEDIITKLAAAPVVAGEGGAGSSLQAEQKRTLHVQAVATLAGSGMGQADVRQLRPIGSTFRFTSDDSDQSAPNSLSYLSAESGLGSAEPALQAPPGR